MQTQTMTRTSGATTATATYDRITLLLARTDLPREHVILMVGHTFDTPDVVSVVLKL